MRPFRETMPLGEAFALMMGAAVPIERRERVPLSDAHLRVLDAAVVASADVPPFNRAAMDGYAVIAEDTAGASRSGPKLLTCVGVLHTGEAPSRALARGECMQIATGAPLPDGATAVVMVEETERASDTEVRVMAPASPGQNVGRRGGDLAAGETILDEGELLTPARVGALAAAGLATVGVYARPRVAILSTGNEVVDPGTPLGPAQVHDVNRYSLGAIVSAHGGIPVLLPRAPDTLDELAAALQQALTAGDLVVFSGGSSVGDRDLILDVIRAHGEVLFHGIAVKPGKPTLFGRVGGQPVLGMPGNPTSCLSNGYLLLVPLLRRIARLPEHRPATLRVPLARRVASTPGRYQIYTVRIVDGAAAPAFKASGDITSMSQADGYIEIPADTEVVGAGEAVVVKLF